MKRYTEKEKEKLFHTFLVREIENSKHDPPGDCVERDMIDFAIHEYTRKIIEDTFYKTMEFAEMLFK